MVKIIGHTDPVTFQHVTSFVYSNKDILRSVGGGIPFVHEPDYIEYDDLKGFLDTDNIEVYVDPDTMMNAIRGRSGTKYFYFQVENYDKIPRSLVEGIKKAISLTK